jgi:putative DNA-invertase from lambdoid prophage Rac
MARACDSVCDTLFIRRGVVVINNFTFDSATRDPMRQAGRGALIGFMAATAQAAQAEATKAAQRAGIENAMQRTALSTLAESPAMLAPPEKTCSI